MDIKPDKLPERGGKYPNLTGGSRKGKPNKATGDIKAMILEALDRAGGADYLLTQAQQPNPTAFLGLIAKVLPLTVAAHINGSIAQLTHEEWLASLK